MNKTTIEWVKNPDGTQGYTLNPIRGKCPMACMDSYGKIYCYNHKRIDRFHLDPIPKFLPEVLDEAEMQMVARKYPLGIFLCSTFEWLWNEQWAQEIYQFCKAWEVCPDVRFYLLTKRPEELWKWSPFPKNVWIGVSATTPEQIRLSFKHLHYDVKASVKFLSFEPMLGMILPFREDWFTASGVNWVIIGARTPYSKKTFPKWEWIKELIDACDRVSVPVFLKNNLRLPKYNCEGAMPFYKHHPTGTMELRQEMPLPKPIISSKAVTKEILPFRIPSNPLSGENWLKEHLEDYTPEEIGALTINISYDKKELAVVSLTDKKGTVKAVLRSL